MAKLILTHDLGTSGGKTVLFDSETGAVLAKEHGDYTTFYGQDGAVEQNPADWWKVVCQNTQRLLSRFDKKDIAAVSFSAMMMGVTAVNKKGEPLCNSLIWADGRSKKQMDVLEERMGPERLYEVSGLRASPYYSLSKLMWIKEHRPEIYKETYKTLHCKEYLVHKLTGKMVTDYSDASGTMAFDVRNKCWSSELLAAADVDGEKFPQMLPGYTVVGEVTPAAAAECGLAPGTPVVLGGGDGPCCRVGMGAVKPGRECVNIGTSALDSLIMDRPIDDKARRVINFNHILPHLVSVTGTMQAAGASITWMKDNLCKEEAARAEKEGGGIFSYINENASSSPLGSNGLLFLPYLQGERAPHWDAHAKGVFLGLTMKHTANDMKRAVYEGIAMNLGLVHQVLAANAPKVSDRLVLTGGAAKSRIVSQTMADVFGMDMVITNLSDEVGAFGAMIVAGHGIGLYPDLDMAEKFMKVEEIIHPIEEHVRYFERLLPVFLESYEALKGVFPKVGV
ncbi:MAG: xylulokinase [Christensenellaceae bacterium]|nr:xylulokinase [Christensenellaceae bacterium]